MSPVSQQGLVYTGQLTTRSSAKNVRQSEWVNLIERCEYSSTRSVMERVGRGRAIAFRGSFLHAYLLFSLDGICLFPKARKPLRLIAL